MDYLPCECKIPIQNLFWPGKGNLLTVWQILLGQLRSIYGQENISSRPIDKHSKYSLSDVTN